MDKTTKKRSNPQIQKAEQSTYGINDIKNKSQPKKKNQAWMIHKKNNNRKSQPKIIQQKHVHKFNARRERRMINLGNKRKYA